MRENVIKIPAKTKFLSDFFSPIFKEHNLKWDRTRSIKLFPDYTKKQRQIKGNRFTYYIFNI